MNLFSYPDRIHSRAQTPRAYRNYKRYKPFLRIEFEKCCVYCRLPDGPRGQDAFGVDHYKPVSKFPKLECIYSNLYYACNTCNRRKRNYWPTDKQRHGGLFIPNPCDHTMSQHLRYEGPRVKSLTLTGRYTEEVLLLNEEEDVNYRTDVLRIAANLVKSIEDGLKTAADIADRLSRARGLQRARMHISLKFTLKKISDLTETLERFAGIKIPFEYSI